MAHDLQSTPSVFMTGAAVCFNGIAISRDGTVAAVPFANRRLLVLDALTWTPRFEFAVVAGACNVGGSGKASGVWFSGGSNKEVIYATGSRMVVRVDLNLRRVVETVAKINDQWNFSMATSGDGLFCCVFDHGNLCLHRLGVCNPSKTPLLPETDPHSPILSMSDNGYTLAASGGNRLYVVDIPSVKTRFDRRLTTTVSHLAVSPDGNRIVYIDDIGVNLAVVDTGETTRVFAIPFGLAKLYRVAFAPDGRSFAVCGQDIDRLTWESTIYLRVFDSHTAHEVMRVPVCTGYLDDFKFIHWADGGEQLEVIMSSGQVFRFSRTLSLALAGTFQPASPLYTALAAQWMYDCRIWSRVAAFVDWEGPVSKPHRPSSTRPRLVRAMRDDDDDEEADGSHELHAQKAMRMG